MYSTELVNIKLLVCPSWAVMGISAGLGKEEERAF